MNIFDKDYLTRGRFTGDRLDVLNSYYLYRPRKAEKVHESEILRVYSQYLLYKYLEMKIKRNSALEKSPLISEVCWHKR